MIEGSGSSGPLTKTGGVNPPTVTALAALAATLLAGAGALALRQHRA